MKIKTVKVRTCANDPCPTQLNVPQLESVRDLEKAVAWIQKVRFPFPVPEGKIPKHIIVKAASDGITILLMNLHRRELKKFD